MSGRASVFLVRTSGLAAVGLVGVVASPLLASPSLQYAVPKDCPERAWFESELASQGLPTVSDGALRVEVAPAGGSVPSELVGDLSYGPSQGDLGRSSWQRRLTSGDCRDLLSALAMSLVLHLEADRVDAEPVSSALDGAEGAEPVPADSGVAQAPSRDDQLAPRRWHFGAGVGGTIRGGVDPELSGALDVHALVRSDWSGWGSGPIAIGFTWAPSTASSARDGGQWSHQWWTGSVAATPGTFRMWQQVRVGPVVALQLGRYLAETVDGTEWDGIVALTELLVRAEMEARPWLVAAQLGLHLPIAPFRLPYAESELHRPTPGVVIGLGASWLGVVL